MSFGTLSSASRFDKLVKEYAKYRPDYPKEVLNHIDAYVNRGNHTLDAIDVGCGTGISTRLLASRAYNVTGVDPNATMLEEAKNTPSDDETKGTISYVLGTDCETHAKDKSVDLITSAQALHWFELSNTFQEWQRILRDGGHCCAFFNLRANTGWQADYEALLHEFSTEHNAINKATQANIVQWPQKLLDASPNVVNIEEHELSHKQVFSWEGLYGRALSSSYVKNGVKDFDGFEKKLKALFEKNKGENGMIDFMYVTYVLLWQFNNNNASVETKSARKQTKVDVDVGMAMKKQKK